MKILPLRRSTDGPSLTQKPRVSQSNSGFDSSTGLPSICHGVFIGAM
jgi:hypothetical protein